MPRTIVYASAGSTRGGVRVGGADAGKADGYTERLSKYIPAEVLAGFLPLVGLTGDRNPLVWVAFAIGLASTIIYLYVHALQETDASKRPRPFFYVLAALAFVVWALGTSDPIRGVLQLDATVSRFMLAVVAFALPGIDLAIDLRFPRPK